MKAIIQIENLKCGGCEASILNHLRHIPGLSSVTVNLETESVEIDYFDEAVLQKAKESLRSLGYPEKGTVEGLTRTALNARSYLSCAIGKINSGSGQ